MLALDSTGVGLQSSFAKKITFLLAMKRKDWTVQLNKNQPNSHWVNTLICRESYGKLLAI